MVTECELMRTSYRDITHYTPTCAATSYYSGNLDRKGFRSQFGTIQWRRNDWVQYYEGEFLKDCLHSKGMYTWNHNGLKHVYEGYFFVNNKEGYGRMSFPDGSVYEGLYKNNRRFGPGILTYPDGTQDVGLWVGKRLIRLISCFGGIVPHLATTKEGQTKLHTYRKLVEVDERVPNFLDTLVKKDAKYRTIERPDRLFCEQTRDPRSLTFNNRIFFSPNTWSETSEGDEEESVEGDKEENKELEERKAENNSLLPDTGSREVTEEGKLKSESSEFLDNGNGQVSHIEDKKPSVIESRSSKNNMETKENVTVEDLMHNELSIGSSNANCSPITQLLAWNNTPQMIELQIHIFKHRNFENTLSYNIEPLITYQREEFKHMGSHEWECLLLMELCQSGTVNYVFKLLSENDLHPDVMDSQGNTGLMFASISNNTNVIDTLLDMGANINHCNDEGLTPLNLCLINHLAVSRDVTDWEAAFLPPKEDDSSLQERTESLDWRLPPLNISTNHYLLMDEKGTSVSESSSVDTGISGLSISVDSLKNQAFIFSLEPMEHEPESPQEVKMSESEVIRTVKTKRDSVVMLKVPYRSREDLKTELKKHRLVDSTDTIVQLLNRGADPNVSIVPRPSLILAVYSRNTELVEILLKSGANPNIYTLPADGGLTALHHVTLLPPCEETVKTCEVLVRYGADPNFETQGENELEQKLRILSNRIVNEGYLKAGRTALHTLCMRPDANFDTKKQLNEICTLLLEKGLANPNALYVGHSPLSLAIREGNMELIYHLLQSGMVNPNQNLSPDLGVPLTVLLTDEGKYKMHTSDQIKVAVMLVDYGADPLKIIKVGEDFEGNVVDFGFWILEKNKRPSKPIITNETKENGKKNAKHSVLLRKVSGYMLENRRLLSNLQNLTRQRILRHVQGNVVRHMVNFVKFTYKCSLADGNLAKCRLMRVASKWLTPDDLLNCLYIMHQAGVLKITKEQSHMLMDFVLSASKNERSKEHQDYYDKLSFLTSGEKQSSRYTYLSSRNQEKRISSSVSARSNKRKKSQSNVQQGTSKDMMQHRMIITTPFVVYPELDKDETKYQVCFECGQTRGKTLQTCPICELISFCSVECNAHDTQHICGIMFYGSKGKSQKRRWMSITESIQGLKEDITKGLEQEETQDVTEATLEASESVISQQRETVKKEVNSKTTSKLITEKGLEEHPQEETLYSQREDSLNKNLITEKSGNNGKVSRVGSDTAELRSEKKESERSEVDIQEHESKGKKADDFQLSKTEVKRTEKKQEQEETTKTKDAKNDRREFTKKEISTGKKKQRERSGVDIQEYESKDKKTGDFQLSKTKVKRAENKQEQEETMKTEDAKNGRREITKKEISKKKQRERSGVDIQEYESKDKKTDDFQLSKTKVKRAEKKQEESMKTENSKNDRKKISKKEISKKTERKKSGVDIQEYESRDKKVNDFQLSKMEVKRAKKKQEQEKTMKAKDAKNGRRVITKKEIREEHADKREGKGTDKNQEIKQKTSAGNIDYRPTSLNYLNQIDKKFQYTSTRKDYKQFKDSVTVKRDIDLIPDYEKEIKLKDKRYELHARDTKFEDSEKMQEIKYDFNKTHRNNMINEQKVIGWKSVVMKRMKDRPESNEEAIEWKCASKQDLSTSGYSNKVKCDELCRKIVEEDCICESENPKYLQTGIPKAFLRDGNMYFKLNGNVYQNEQNYSFM